MEVPSSAQFSKFL